MSNVCVACGAEIPDECGSMICKSCYNETHSDDLTLGLIHPKDGDIVVASLNLNKITHDEAQMVFNKLSRVFPNNYVVAIPHCVCIEAMDVAHLKGLINDLEELYNSIVHKEE